MRLFDVFEIPVRSDFENKDTTYSRSQYKGYICTYAQLASEPEIHRRLCDRWRTVVIFDEAHRLGDEKMHGDVCADIFKSATWRISLTATNERTDGAKIPVLDYEERNGVLVPIEHVRYGLARAIADRYLRFPLFEMSDGNLRITRGDESTPGKMEEMIRNEEIRLRDILWDRTPGGVIDGMICAGAESLRRYHDGGNVADKAVIRGIDIEHARAIKTLAEKAFGKGSCIVIVSVKDDDGEAAEKIERFKKDRSLKVAIVVGLLSEGFDHPPCRAVIWGTNIQQWIPFIQTIGRVLRRYGRDDSDATVHLPNTPILSAFRDRIYNEIPDGIRQEMEEEIREKRERGPRCGPVPERPFFDVMSQWEQGEVVDPRTNIVITPDDVTACKLMLDEVNDKGYYVPIPAIQVLRDRFGLGGQDATQPVQRHPEDSTKDRWEFLRGLHGRLIKKRYPYPSQETSYGDKVKACWNEVYDAVGGYVGPKSEQGLIERAIKHAESLLGR